MQGEIFLGHLTSGYSVVPGFVPGTNQPSISGQIILDSMKCVVVFYIVASIVAKACEVFFYRWAIYISKILTCWNLLWGGGLKKSLES